MRELKDIAHNGKTLAEISDAHDKWRRGEDGGARADLRGANLRGANLGGAYLGGADLRDADLRDADLRGANLRGAYLGGANLRDADLRDADLRDADLRDADLRDAYLGGATGNMREIRSLQIETWPVTYTAEILQIGCHRHHIDMWRKSDPRWIAAMGSKAVDWWAKFGPIILGLIDASPATPTGHEGKKKDTKNDQ